MSALFAGGRILLLKAPVNGHWGINRLYERITSDMMGFKYDDASREELWVVFFNRRLTRMRIMHIQPDRGYSLIIRVIYSGRFRVILEGAAGKPVNITREQLQKLVDTGTY